jgi:dTMP kinase
MFITFEGPEGSGKSTQIKALAAFLVQRGYDVLVTREPGGTSIGDQIRDCLHNVDNTAMTGPTEFLLYSASRAQLVREVLRPALMAGRVVLCDRFADSTIAYQGYGRGLDLDSLTAVTAFATQGLAPDLTLLLDIDVEQGLARRVAGAEEMNRLDLETVAFHRRVRDGYQQLAHAEPGRWHTIDAGRAADMVQEDIRTAVLSRLPVP